MRTGEIRQEDFIGFERFLRDIRGDTDREKLRKMESKNARLQERIRKLSDRFFDYWVETTEGWVQSEESKHMMENLAIMDYFTGPLNED